MSSLSSELDHYELSQSFVAHGGAVRSLSLHQNLLLSSGFDGSLILSTMGTDGKYSVVSQFSDSSSQFYSCCFNPEATRCFGGNKDGNIINWDYYSSSVLEGHTSVVGSIECYD